MSNKHYIYSREKDKFAYEYITKKEVNRFLGNPITDYIVTGISAALFCTVFIWGFCL